MKLLEKIRDAIIIALFSVSIAFLILKVPVTLGIFDVTQNIIEQNEVMDSYFNINKLEKENNAYTVKDYPVYIVDIADCYDRKELADCFRQISEANPRLVGIDIQFEQPQDTLADKSLVNSLKQLDTEKKLITTTYLEGFNEQLRANALISSFFQDQLASPAGYSNYLCEGKAEICRHFHPFVIWEQDTLYSFPTAIAQIVAPEKVKTILKSQNTGQVINYTYNNFVCIHYKELSHCKEILEGQIVLVGDMAAPDDTHMAADGSPWSGVAIHAAVLSTILSGNYIREISIPSGWMITFIFIFLLALLQDALQQNQWVRLTMPIIQFLLIMLMLFLGYWIFIHHFVYVRSFQLLLSVGFIGFAYDFYHQVKKYLFHALRWIYEKLRISVNTTIHFVCNIKFKKK